MSLFRGGKKSHDVYDNRGGRRQKRGPEKSSKSQKHKNKESLRCAGSVLGEMCGHPPVICGVNATIWLLRRAVK